MEGQYLYLTGRQLMGTRIWGFPGGTSGKEPTCQCRRRKRCRFDPWVGKIPWRRRGQPTLVFLCGKSHGQRRLVGYSPWSCKELNMTEQLSSSSRTYIIETARNTVLASQISVQDFQENFKECSCMKI